MKLNEKPLVRLDNIHTVHVRHFVVLKFFSGRGPNPLDPSHTDTHGHTHTHPLVVPLVCSKANILLIIGWKWLPPFALEIPSCKPASIQNM